MKGTAPHTVAPWSQEAEIAVLGAALQWLEAAHRLLAELRPEQFFRAAHATVAAAIARVRERGLQADVRSVGEYLREAKQLDSVGGAVALTDLADAVATAANGEHYVRTVREKWQLRRLLEACARASERAKANGTPPGDIAADQWDEIHDLERTAEPGAILVRLSDVAPERIVWTWDARFPLGKLSLIVGDPGLGKSFVCMDLTSRVTIGGTGPDGTPAPKGSVVILTAEDGLADTIRPRTDRQGGDASRVHVLTGIGDPEKPASFNLATDLPHLEDAVLRTRASLVIIDPLSAYLGGETNSHRDADVRGLLAPLATMAERNRLAVLGVMHLNKSEQNRALYRVSGALAFVAASRAVFAVVGDQDEPGRRLFLPLKTNLGPKPPTLAFRIDADGLRWEAGTVGVDAETALGGWEAKAERNERQEAASFLREALANGSVPVDEVKKQAKAAGISEATLRRAKESLRIEPYNVGYPGVWMWALSPNPLTGARVEHPEQDRARSD